MVIKGIPASPGIAIGKAFLYKENKLIANKKVNILVDLFFHN